MTWTSDYFRDFAWKVTMIVKSICIVLFLLKMELIGSSDSLAKFGCIALSNLSNFAQLIFCIWCFGGAGAGWPGQDKAVSDWNTLHSTAVAGLVSEASTRQLKYLAPQYTDCFTQQPHYTINNFVRQQKIVKNFLLTVNVFIWPISKKLWSNLLCLYYPRLTSLFNLCLVKYNKTAKSCLSKCCCGQIFILLSGFELCHVIPHSVNFNIA